MVYSGRSDLCWEFFFGCRGGRCVSDRFAMRHLFVLGFVIRGEFEILNIFLVKIK